MKKNLLLALVAALSCTAAFAEGEKKEGAPAMPALPPEGKRLVESMLGKWKSSDVVLTMGDQKINGTFKVDCDKVSGGWGAVCKGKMDAKGMPAQEVTFLYGWDVGAAEGHMFEVSNMAETHNHVGKWTDEKNITLVHTGKTADGKDEKDSLALTLVSPKEVLWKAEGTQGATTVWTFSGTAKK